MLQWNVAFETYFNNNRGILIKIGDRPDELFPPGSPYIQLWKDYYLRAIKTPFSTEYKVISGTRILRLAINQIIQDGKLIGLSVFGKDITEQAKAIQALAESQVLFQAVTENSLAGLYIIQEGKLIFVNHAFAEIFGYEPEQLLGVNPMEITLPEDRALVAENIRKRDSGEVEKIQYVFRGLCKNGETKFVEVLGGRTTVDGKPAVVGAMLDLTYRKNEEDKRKKLDQQFTAAFMTGLDAQYIATLTTGLILQVNNNFTSVFGYTREEAVGKTSKELDLYFDYSERQQIVADLKTRGYVKDLEIKERKKGGEIATISLSISILSNEGDGLILGVARDITQQKQAGELLVQSEERFRVIFEKAKDGIVITNENDDIVSCNMVYCDLLGYSYEELCKMKIRDIQAPEARTQANSINKERALLENLVFESIDLHRSGKKIPVEISVGSFEQASKKLFVSIVRDISERKQAEEIIRENEELFRSSFESAIAGISMVSKDGKFIKVNQEFCRILSYSSEELLQLNFNAITYEEDKEIGISYLEQMLSGEIEHQSFEKRYVRKDGGILWVVVSISAIRNNQNEFQYFVTYTRDITANKLAEQALKERDRELQESQQIAWLGTYSFDIASGLYSTSEIMDDIFGIDKTYDHSYQGWINLIHPEDRDRLNNFVQKDVLERGILGNIEFRIIRANDGATRWLHALAKPDYDINGKPIRFYGTSQDITNRKETEIAFQEKELYATRLAQHLQVINQIGLNVTAGLGFDNLFQTIYEQCQHIVDTDTFFVAMYDEASSTVSFPFYIKDGESNTSIP